MSIDEALDVTRIYSVADQLPSDTPLIQARPFRAPHHTISHAGLVGGGNWLHPGEIKIGEIIHNFVHFIHISDPTTTTDSHLININKDSEAVVVVDHQNGENFHNFGEKFPKIQDTVLQDTIPMDPISEEAFSALRSCGIGEPKRSALARLSWVTPDFIDKWKTHLRGRGKLDTALLIHCLEGRDPPPEPEPEKESVYDQVLKSDTPFSLLTNPEDM
jgi:hypothetical protein